MSVVSVNERSKNERSVMQSIEQEETTNNEIVPTPKKTTAQIPQQPMIDKTLVMSTMRISKPGDNAVVKIVKHIHWRNWPDHGVPDNFLSPFRLLTVVKSCTKPIVVHCSAGVGRTGTLALILIILESICLPDFIGVPRLLAKLREERFRAIQTEVQYLYAHRCVLEYLALKKYVQSREDFAKFAKDYEQALATCPKEM
nr:hypothetical protein ZK1251.5 - Caenorhabditis elegans [Caenorhabditis elegans]